MRGAVTLAMPEIFPIGKDVCKSQFEVMHDIGVRVFVDGYRCSCMRAIDYAKALFYTAYPDALTHLRRDIDKAIIWRTHIEAIHSYLLYGTKLLFILPRIECLKASQTMSMCVFTLIIISFRKTDGGVRTCAFC